MATPQHIGAHAPSHAFNREKLTSIFEWYENPVEKTLEHVFRQDVPQRGRLHELIQHMQDSNKFEYLAVAYRDALQVANGDPLAEANALLGFACRIYAAGTLHPHKVMENEMRW